MERVVFSQRIRADLLDKVRGTKPSEFNLGGWFEALLEKGLESFTSGGIVILPKKSADGETRRRRIKEPRC